MPAALRASERAAALAARLASARPSTNAECRSSSTPPIAVIVWQTRASIASPSGFTVDHRMYAVSSTNNCVGHTTQACL